MFNFEKGLETNNYSQKLALHQNLSAVETRRRSSASVLQKMTTALENPRKFQNSNSASIFNNHVNKNDPNLGTDDDSEAVQRYSFVSSSTGYSSARSSLRSSEISDDTSSNLMNLPSAKKLLTQESSISEQRRLKLLNNGLVTQLDRIAMELLETERCYVNDLNDVIQGYLNYLVDHREEFEVTVDDISNTFGCIERIFFFNKKLYHELDAAQLNVVCMAKCLSDNVQGFNDYVTYCTRYQIMIETLSNLMKKKRVAEILKLRQAFLGHSLPLSAYLLKPVQRVLKYHLFLENILKSCAETKIMTESDRNIIIQALHCMTAQAEKINDEKKRAEHVERVRELQNALHKWCIDEKEDLSKYGDLLLEATFKLAGAKTNRQLFLFEEMLLIVKERNGALICKDYIMCSSLMLNESISIDPLAFQVLSYDNPKIQYIFLAASMDQKRCWMKELKRMMLDHYGVKIPEKTKMLMLSLSDECAKSIHPPNQQGQILYPKSNKRIPKYLEKRRKSIDINQTFRRSHLRKRSASGNRNVPKSSSTGNIVKELETFLESDSILKIAKHSCSFISHIKPSTSTAKNVWDKNNVENTCKREDVKSSSSLISSQSLFVKRKSSEVNKKKSVCERKNSTVSLLSPSPCKEFQTSKSFLESALNVCKPQQKQANLRNQYSTKDSTNSLYSRSKPTYTHSDDHCCAQKHFDETMAMLYRELQLLMKNTDNHNENIESNMQMDRRSDTSVPKSDSYTNKCKAFNNLLEHKKRSRSLNKFDGEILEEKLTEGEKLNKISFPFVDESPQNSIKRHTGVNTEVIAVNSDSQNCEVSYSCATESEDNDEAVNVISWSESPHFGEKFHSSTLHHNIHHRRRSSQVAEQVWRLRHRQEQERKNGVDKNLSLSTSAKMDEFVTTKISRVSNPSTVPLDHVHSTRILSARQRTPLTVEQCAQLDESLDPKLGVVKEMIKQLEKPLSLITASHAI